MNITDKDILEALKKEWEQTGRMIDSYPKYTETYISEFMAMTKFAGKLTGKRYTVTEDGVIEY